MRSISYKISAAGLAVLLAVPAGFGQTGGPVTLQIRADQVTAKMPPTFHGLMTEEINYAFEGGLYGELIRNRNFKETVPERRNRQTNETTPAKKAEDLVHWSLVESQGGKGTMALDTSAPLNAAVPASLKLTVSQAAGNQSVGVANDGFWGIPARPTTTYKAVVWAKASAGFAGTVTLAIVGNESSANQGSANQANGNRNNANQTNVNQANVNQTTGVQGNVVASTTLPKLTGEWKKYETTLTTPTNVVVSADNRFVVSANRPGTVWLGYVSLFPPTYKGRVNGFRPDLMELLAGLKPQFLRFPGGNYLEGNTFDTRFNWKKTIGPVEERPGHMNDAWGYWSSDGMGLLEYLNWCEDLGMEPVLAVFAGYSLRGQKVKPGPELDVFVKEALEEIEYVSGGANTEWGARRAKDGHPAPFKLRYVEIGNEDFFDREKGSYDARYTVFHDAIKKKYPELLLIDSAGFSAASLTSRVPDVHDDHYYRGSDEMVMHANDYQGRPRTGPKVFVGEWATRVGAPTPNLEAAIADAANMAGLQRNADLVMMHCYAPLFVNVNPGAMQWTTDLIGYDTVKAYGSPAYWAQQMFANHVGSEVVNLTVSGMPYKEWQQPARRQGGGNGGGRGAPAADASGMAPQTPQPVPLPEMFFSVTKDAATGMIYANVVNRQGRPQAVNVKLSGVASVAATGRSITLSGASPNDTNSITEMHKVEPVVAEISGVSLDFTRTFPANSITVLELRGK